MRERDGGEELQTQRMGVGVGVMGVGVGGLQEVWRGVGIGS